MMAYIERAAVSSVVIVDGATVGSMLAHQLLYDLFKRFTYKQRYILVSGRVVSLGVDDVNDSWLADTIYIKAVTGEIGGEMNYCQ